MRGRIQRRSPLIQRSQVRAGRCVATSRGRCRVSAPIVCSGTTGRAVSTTWGSAETACSTGCGWPASAGTGSRSCAAGGNGSPPGTRGRPRRRGTALNPAVVSADTAAGATTSSGTSSSTTAPAGGQGSPPATRGRPRRSGVCCAALNLSAPSGKLRWSYFRASSSAMTCGTTSKMSPTMPKSAISKIGASASLLMATMVSEVCIPTRCCTAPEMPIPI